jgi:hypothetical protein
VRDGIIELGDRGSGLPPERFRVEIDDRPIPAASPEVLARWEAKRRANPRLFNGPVLSLTGIDGGVVHARRDSYQRLAVQGEAPELVAPPVVQVSVTGLVTARDDAGRRHVLVGQRSDATRIYGSQWELGPAGGLEPPPASARSLDGLDVFRQLVEEMREEVGLPADPDPGPVVALALDATAMSCDAVMLIELARPLEEVIAHTEAGARRGWEYRTTRWVPTDLFGAFVRAERCIPPTAALSGLVERLR